MTSRLIAIASSVLAVGVAGVGVSLADDSPDGYGGQGGSQSKPTHEQQQQQPPATAPSEDMIASRLSWSAYLTGKAEVDSGGDDAGDPDAKGSAMFLQIDERTICYGFAVRGTDEPTIVHIHKGVAGAAGPDVITFANPPKNAAGAPSGNPGASSGCKTLEKPEEIAALVRIRRNPSNYYVNFHTKQFPDGAVRGQLSRLWYDNKP